MGIKFDEELRKRLLAFQKKNGIPTTGIADTGSWAALLGQSSGGTAPAAATGQPVAAAGAEMLAGYEIVATQGVSGFAAPATGEVVIAETSFGEGFYLAAEANAVLAADAQAGIAATATETAVTVGGTTVAEGTVASIGTFGSIAKAVAALGRVVATGAAASGLALVGAVVVAGTVYVVVKGTTGKPKQGSNPYQEYPNTSLPGGAPPPAVAPGAGPATPAQAPGTSDRPATAPGGEPPRKVETPGQPGDPVTAPGVVDDPDVCLLLIKKGTTHDHHIIPRQFIHEAEACGINVDEFTVTLGAAEHIGSKGVHVTHDWNGEWYDFYATFPTKPLSPAQVSRWHGKTLTFAAQLCESAKIDTSTMHWYRKPNQPSGKP